MSNTNYPRVITPARVLHAHRLRGMQYPYIKRGSSGMVGFVNDKQVLKYPLKFDTSRCDCEVTRQARFHEKESAEDIEREKMIYRLIGHHDNIVRYYWDSDEGICLEYLKEGSLRDFLKPSIDISTRLAWAYQATCALQHLHQKGILWVDVSARNCLLTEDKTLKLCDFGGSGLKDLEPMVMAESRYRKPAETMTMSTDLFSLGSLFYEIMTGKPPYDTLSDDEIQTRFESHIYPETAALILGNVICKCWAGDYQDCEQVIQDIDLVK